MALFPLNSADVVAASSCDECYINDGKCDVVECEEDLGCVWCDSEDCEKTCPCVPSSQGCSGYGTGDYCQFDAQCAEGLHCSGHKGGFLSEQACCPIGKEWDFETKSCGTEQSQYNEYTQKEEEEEFVDYFGDGFGDDLGFSDKDSCDKSCADGDWDCDGNFDDICFADVEVCDGQDNDLDGVIDDGVCSENCGRCGHGWFDICEEHECKALGNCVFTDKWIGGSCSPAGNQEVCIQEVCDNNIDDDCDGDIDEGCAYGGFYNEDISQDIGLKKHGEFFCNYDGQCNPGLSCLGSKSSVSAVTSIPLLGAVISGIGNLIMGEGIGGGCCFEWEEWNSDDRECYDTRLNVNTLGCDKDDHCQPGLHCSWEGLIREGACCPEGKEWDTSAGMCIECGVLAKPGDSDYCSQKEEIGCTCNAGEGNCANDDECFAGTYCSATKNWLNKWWSYDICCPKGTVYNPITKNCTGSALSSCIGETKEACFSSGESCCFDEEDGCGICTDLHRNERVCENDNCCCDMENGCDDSVNLSCSTGICCYPWEELSDYTGRCTLECESCDEDKDGYSNEFEIRVFANPMNSDDSPWKRLQVQHCGTIFEPAKPNVIPMPASYPGKISSVADLNTTKPKESNAGGLGFMAGLVSGAIGGLWDDIQLLKLLYDGVSKLMEFTAFMTNDPRSASIQSGYSWNQTQHVVGSIWADLGKTITNAFVNGLDGISQQGEDINIFYHEDCPKVEFIKGYTNGYVIGYIAEQIAMAFIGVSEIKAAVQAGFGTTKIGKLIIEGLEVVEKVLSKIKSFTKGVIDNVIVTIKELRIKTIASWSDEAIEGFGRIVKHGGKSYTRKLMQELGEAGLKRASKKIALLAADYGDDAVELMIKSKIGRVAIKQNWAQKAQRAVLKTLQEVGEDKIDNIVGGLSKTTSRKIGIRLNKIATEVGDEAAEALLKSPVARKALTELSEEASKKVSVLLLKESSEDVATLMASRLGAEALDSWTQKEVSNLMDFMRRAIGDADTALFGTSSKGIAGRDVMESIHNTIGDSQFRKLIGEGKYYPQGSGSRVDLIFGDDYVAVDHMFMARTRSSNAKSQAIREHLVKFIDNGKQKNILTITLDDPEDLDILFKNIEEALDTDRLRNLDAVDIYIRNGETGELIPFNVKPGKNGMPRIVMETIQENEEIAVKFMSNAKIEKVLATLGKGLTTRQQSTLKKVLAWVDADMSDDLIKNIDLYGGSEGLKPYLTAFEKADENGQKALAMLLEDMYGDSAKIQRLANIYGRDYVFNAHNVPTGAARGNIVLRGEGYDWTMVQSNYPYLSTSDLEAAKENFADFIFRHGMQKSGKSDDIIRHIEGYTKDSIFHSTTTDMITAQGTAIRSSGEGYIFIINPDSSSKIIYTREVIKKNLKRLNHYQAEFEITIKGVINSNEIIGAIHIDAGKITEFVPNPYFG